MNKRLFSLLLALVLIVTAIGPIQAKATTISQESAVKNFLLWANFTPEDMAIVGNWVDLAHYVGLVREGDNFDPGAPCTNAYYNTLRQRANELFRRNSEEKIPVAPFIKVATQPESVVADLNTEVTLTATVSMSNGSKIAYQWYFCDNKNKDNATVIEGATTESHTVTPTEGRILYYFCRFSAKDDETVESVDSDVVCVTDKHYVAIVTQPKDLAPYRGGEATLLATAFATNDGDVSRQWYSCDDAQKTNATPIEGATLPVYNAPTEVCGDYYYFCRFSSEGLTDVDSDVVCVHVWLPQFDDATALNFFEYTVDTQAGSVLLSKYIGAEKTVVVAPFYTVDGTVYKTVLDSTTVFYQNTKITDVKLYEGVSFANNTMKHLFFKCTMLVSANLSGVNTSGITDMSSVFEGCTKLTTLDMTGIDTSSVTTMYRLFYDCKSLKSLTGYEHWDTRSLQNISGSFHAVSPLKIIDLSHWDLSKIESSRICFQTCKAEQILLPDNLKTINAFFMNHAINIKGTTFTIPAGVERIGYAHTFYDFATDAFTEFIIAEGNKNFKAIDGILYSADGKEMLAIPRGKTFENNTFVVPEGVEFFAELSFSRNYNIHTLLLPNSYEIVQYVPLNDPRYTISGDSGNINNGSNLNIATYRYTGITDYAVKDDNPRYESVDGIIYSEDMTTVLAVPRRYNRLINIPEGVTTIAFDALRGDGGMSNCTGIYIPSTVTKISSEVYSALNTLRAKYPKTFTITVNPDNPAYSVDANGALVVVSPFVEIYQQPEDLLPALGEQAILSVGAAVSDTTAPSYQWYSCVDENKTNATPIAGATEATFSAPTKDFGAVYYFCRLSAEKAETVDTDVICVDITTALSSFEYTVDADAGTVLLSKYIGTEKTVVVPPFYTVDGTVHKTVLDSTTVFYQNTKITDVKLYEGVSFANNTMANLFHDCLYLVNADLSGVNTSGITDMSSVFEGCTKLTTLDMTGIDTSSVTTMAYLFYNCTALANLIGYEYWDTSSLQNITGCFNKVSPLKIIDLSRWDLSKIESSRICFQQCKAEQILLPDNLKTINAFFMNHAEKIQGETFTIPVGVEKIGYDHVFYNFGTTAFKEFIVAPGNKNYVAIDGILYSADGTEMLAIPKGKTFENGVYEIPEGVTFLGMLSFSRNPYISTVVIPNSLELKFVPARDPAYTLPGDNGNINPGNNLNIAIYIQGMNVTAYEAKADNPRYTSRDGVIYSKDMTTLVAFPTWYNKHLNIPEGVTTIVYEASLGASSVDDRMKNCTGVHIPSTLTNISSDQLDKFNRLRTKYPDTFIITVSADNPVYALNSAGILVQKNSEIGTQPNEDPATNVDSVQDTTTSGSETATNKVGHKLTVSTTANTYAAATSAKTGFLSGNLVVDRRLSGIKAGITNTRDRACCVKVFAGTAPANSRTPVAKSPGCARVFPLLPQGSLAAKSLHTVE